MSETKLDEKKPKILDWVSSTGRVLVAVGMLAGCSQVPDAVNPVEWYNSTVEFFSGEDEEPQQSEGARKIAKKADADAAGKKEFPKVATVQQRQQTHQRRAEGLVADTEARRYAPSVARQGEAVNALGSAPSVPPPPSAVATAPQQPAPPASPAAPVTSAATEPTQMAAAPATMSSSGDVFSTADQGNFQERFTKRLAEIREQAKRNPALPITATQPIGPDTFDTVIVSADGVEAGYAQAAASAMAPVEVAAASAPTPFGQRPVRSRSGNAVKVATIHFANGSAKLSGRDRRILANVKQLLAERGGRLFVVGHASSRTRNTDPVKHKMINFKVSADRADAVARELQRMGIDSNNIQVDAVSDSDPIYYEFMPSGEAGNRRTEIYLES